MRTRQDQIRESIEYLEEYSKTLTVDATDYWKFHKMRFEWTAGRIVEIADKLDQRGKPVKRILDIGPSYQTMLLEKIFPEAQIDTLGFFDKRYALNGQTHHIHFDLNDTYDREKWPDLSADKYDIIVMLEVIEHLYTSPRLVFDFLGNILHPHGFLVIQTPNAVSLGKRMTMLKGKNPYELIRETRTNPGHFREYTKKEMCRLAEAAGLEVDQIYMVNYFNIGGWLSKISNFLPGSLRDGATYIFRKKD